MDRWRDGWIGRYRDMLCEETVSEMIGMTDGYTGKLIIGIYRNLSEVSPIISDNFIGSDKFIG
jgi:hypothetical protein